MNEELRLHSPEPRRCANCGAELGPGSNFCAACGASTNEGQIQPALLATETMPRPEYMGFWIRLLAWLIDAVLLAAANLLLARAGLNILTFFVAPIYGVLFIGFKGQTIGKMALGIKVIDAEGNVPGLWRAISFGKSWASLFLVWPWDWGMPGLAGTLISAAGMTTLAARM